MADDYIPPLENDAWLEPLYTYSAYVLTAITIGMTLLVFLHQPITSWVERKRYQYEVTMPLYIMTDAERFVFNSILFLVSAMIVLAVVLYLPEHVSIISRRVVYYLYGLGSR